MVGDAFKALGDPTRRRILELLSEGEMSAGDIAAHFDMAKPSVSHHLNILKNAGLVTDERRGQNIVYCLNLTVFQEAVKWFFDFVLGAADFLRHQLCGAPLLLWLPAGCCAHPLGRGRPGQRLGAKIHCADYGSPARPDADFDGSAAPH